MLFLLELCKLSATKVVSVNPSGTIKSLQAAQAAGLSAGDIVEVVPMKCFKN